jgi:thiol-disulfide isomerase/thioredoxin
MSCIRSLSLALGAALVVTFGISACTPLDKSGGVDYDRNPEGKEMYKGEDVSKFHKKKEGGGEDTNPGKDHAGCPLPPSAENDVLTNIKVGDSFPDFNLKSVTDGSDVSRARHARGHYQLLLVWASWCPYCQKASSQLLKPLFEDLGGDKGKVDIIAVGIDLLGDTPEGQKAYLNSNGFKWTGVFDKDGVVRNAAGASFIPTAILLDEQGKVVTYGYYEVDRPYTNRLNQFLRDACEFKDKHPGK